MAGFLRRKNKQPVTVVDTTTTTTKKGGAPPLFSRFATTATKSSDDVPRIVSSPMSLASNRGGGGASPLEGSGNRQRTTSQVAGNDRLRIRRNIVLRVLGGVRWAINRRMEISGHNLLHHPLRRRGLCLYRLHSI